MGEVWLAEDSRLQRRVALKMVRATAAADAASRERLMREARAAAALNHPHIATVHDVLEEQGEVVIVFEYVEGETLHARIARERIPVPDAIDIASQIAKALAAAHANGIIHRDLKPANVIIGADRHVKVLDFGIARILAVGATQTTAAAPPATASGMGFIGTASYAAPEQMVSSAVDARADLYALGVVLFEMVSGRRPFLGSDPVQLATSKLGTDAPPLSSTGQLVPPALEQLVARLLERDRDKRPETSHDVLTELRAIAGTTSTDSLPIRPSRSPVIAIAAAVLIVVLGGYGVWQLRQFMSAPPTNASAPPVIAVLPLTNNSGDPSRDFVAAGIAESLISSLAAVPSVTVLSRAAVTEARIRIKDSAALTRDLGAAYLVDGSVQESGGTVRVSLNLIRSDRSIAWGDSLEGTFENIFELQTRLASALTNALVVRVSASERERMEAQPTTSPRALSAYWQGRALMERRDMPANVVAAITAFTEATTLDPRFALAHAALGEAYWRQYVTTRDQSWVSKAIDSGTTALRLDANHPQVRYTLAVTLAGTGKLEEAVDELNIALAIQPNYEDARRLLGDVLARRGQIDQAVAEYQKAIALRPTGWGNWSAMGLSLLQASKYKEAAEAFIKVTELQPDSLFGYQQLGTVYSLLGEHDLALQNYERTLAIQPNPQAYSNIGAIHHLRGQYAQAVDAYKKAIELRPNSHITWRNLGDSYRRLGRPADATAAYQRAITLAEADLKVDSRDGITLSQLAVYLAKIRRDVEAQSRIREALRLRPDDPVMLFRSAEVDALSGRSEQALASLKSAAAMGLAVSRIREEEDFEPLRKTPAFRSLTEGENK
jgi:serine/threonine-protein kinase